MCLQTWIKGVWKLISLLVLRYSRTKNIFLKIILFYYINIWQISFFFKILILSPQIRGEIADASLPSLPVAMSKSTLISPILINCVQIARCLDQINGAGFKVFAAMSKTPRSPVEVHGRQGQIYCFYLHVWVTTESSTCYQLLVSCLALPWKWRRHVPTKRQCTPVGLLSVHITEYNTCQSNAYNTLRKFSWNEYVNDCYNKDRFSTESQNPSSVYNFTSYQLHYDWEDVCLLLFLYWQHIKFDL